MTTARTGDAPRPAALLLTALGRSETLRSLGEETIDGKKHQLITFADSDGTQIGLFFEAASGLLTRFDTLADSAVLGDALTENGAPGLSRRRRPACACPRGCVTRVAGEATWT